MSFVAVAVGGSALIGGLASSSAAGKAASSAENATALGRDQFNTVQQEEAPYRAAGANALSQMQDPKFQKGFTSADFKVDPGYQFALKQGSDALSASQAAQGNNISGAGLTALNQYNTGMANQGYQQAFNNFNQTQNQNYSRLSTLANLGAGGNAQTNAAGMNFANNAGANSMAAGSAGAQGDVGIANALSGGLKGFANMPSSPKNNYGNGGPSDEFGWNGSSGGPPIAGGAADQITPMSAYGGVASATV